MTTPPAARLVPARIFYGWVIAVGCAVLLMVTIGMGYYGLAVFLTPLRDEHGWSNTVVSGATGLYFAIGGLTGALIGGRIDRHGPRRLQVVGVLLLAAAIASVGHVREPWQLYVAYSVLAVGFGMSSSIAVNAILARWFVTRRARAMSISSTGISVGGVLLVPIGTWLVESSGLARAGATMAVVTLVLSLPVVLWVLVFTPEEMGLEPDGGAPPLASARRPTLDLAAQQRTWTRRQAMATLAFWAILVSFSLTLMAQTGFVIHQISFLTDRFDSSGAAAAALSTTAFGSIVARLVVGTFADGLDKRLLTAALFTIQGAAVALVVLVEHTAVTYLLVLVVGFTIGNVYMMQSLLVGDCFGMVSFGSILGLVGVASQTMSGIGPFVVGWLEDASGGYQTPFLVAAGTTIVAALVVLLARPPATDAEPSPASPPLP